MSTFTIPFPEYDIANILQEKFPKKENFSISVPLSRQQKFYDLIIVNGVNKKFLMIQVKSSRTYRVEKRNDRNSGFYSFFGRFDIKNNYSDYYFFYMTYPLFNKDGQPRALWGRKLLVFNNEEMQDLLDKAITKSGKPDPFFSFGITESGSSVIGGRAIFIKEGLSKYLLENKLAEMRSRL